MASQIFGILSLTKSCDQSCDHVTGHVKTESDKASVCSAAIILFQVVERLSEVISPGVNLCNYDYYSQLQLHTIHASLQQAYHTHTTLTPSACTRISTGRK